MTCVHVDRTSFKTALKHTPKTKLMEFQRKDKKELYMMIYRIEMNDVSTCDCFQDIKMRYFVIPRVARRK